MFLGTGFGKNLDILHRTLDATTLRHSVLANNIANADTPNFKRTVVNFESALGDALASERPPRFEAARSHPRHISFHKKVSYTDVRPRRVLDFLTETKNNGNNVDIEEESMNLLNNQMMYQFMSRSVADQFSRMNIVLRG